MPASSFVSSWPAAPTNGMPCLSSWNPGASPTNISSARGEPAPKTTWVRDCARAHLVHPAATSAYAIRERSVPAASTCASAAAATTERGLRGGAVRCEGARELLGHLQVAAVRAARIGIRHAHELLEVGLAAHADVFVDRHSLNPSKAPSSRLARTDAIEYAGRARHPEAELERQTDVRERQRDRRGPRRLDDRRAAARAGRRAARGRRAPPPLRARPRHRGGGRSDRAGAVGGPRLGWD